MTKRELIKRPLAAILADLPDMCFARRPGDDALIAIKKGEAGYHLAADAGDAGVRIRRTLVGAAGDTENADVLNAALGVTDAQAHAMLGGSMFGFDCPGADPLNFHPRKPDGVFTASDRTHRR